MYVATGLEHDENGHANYTPEVRIKMTEKRYRKMRTLAAELDANGNGTRDDGDGADVGVIGWGSTEGPINEAILRAGKNGMKVAHIHPRVLYPLPTESIESFLKPLKKLIVVEENYTSQFSKHLVSSVNVGDTEIINVNQCTGMPYTPDMVYGELEKHA